MRNIAAILLIISIFCNIIPTAAADRINWKNLPADDILNASLTIAKDRRGLMWIGTADGVYTYDGHHMRPLRLAGLPNGNIGHCNVIIEKEGKMYLGTDNGLIICDSGTGSILPSPEIQGDVRTLKFSGDTLWIGTMDGAYAYSTAEDNIKKISEVKSAVYAIETDAEGIIYLGAYNGFYRLDPATDRVDKATLPIDPGKTQVFVNSLLTDPQHDCLWIGTEGALFQFMTDGITLYRIMEVDGNSIKSLANDANGDLLIGTDNGFYILRPEVDVRPFRHDSRNETSIANNVVWDILIDNDCVWVATESGISYYSTADDLREMRLEDVTDLTGGNIIGNILRDSQGALWLGGTNGVIRWGGYPLNCEDVTWFTSDGEYPAYISHNRIRDIRQTAAGNIWIATDGGVNRYDRASKSLVNYSFTDSSETHNANWAYGIVDDPAGNLWVGAYLGGVMGVKESAATRREGRVTVDKIFTQENGLASDFVSQLITDAAGNKWVTLFRDSCVYQIPADGANILKFDVLKTTGKMPERIVGVDDEPGVWCGVDGALVHILPGDTDAPTAHRIATFGSKTGHNGIVAMTPVGEHMWVASQSGLWAVDLTENHRNRLLPISDRITAIHYDTASRRLLLGGIDKLLSLNTSALDTILHADKIEIMEIAYGDSLIANGLPLGSCCKVTLRDKNKSVTIQLTALNFNPLIHSRYTYRTTPLGEWTPLDPEANSLTLSGLEYGEHLIEFSLTDLTEPLAAVKISVPKPWYITSLATAIYIIIAVALLSLAIVALFHHLRRGMPSSEPTEEKF